VGSSASFDGANERSTQAPLVGTTLSPHRDRKILRLFWKGFRTDTEGRHHSPLHEAYLREVASPATIAVSKTHTLSMFFHAWVIGEATEALNIPISDPTFQFVAARELAFEYRRQRSRFFSACSSRAGVPFSL